MPIPLHTFAPTGDPLVDHENYFRAGLGPRVDPEEWFEKNPAVLSHRPAEIIRDSIKFLTEERAPCERGIYFLIHRDQIVYVGKAQNIYGRLESHYWRTHKRFDRYWCFGGIPYDWLGHAEGFYIKICRPYWNISEVRYSKALDRIAKQHGFHAEIAA
jgi:hypothetical protein